MDFLKFKLAAAKLRKKPRFGYDPKADLSRPELTGLIPNERDYDLGTPSLSRRENVTIVAANHSAETSLTLQLNWRPWQDSGLSPKQLVTLASSLTLSLRGSVYHYEHIETYHPSVSSAREGRIVQYGSSDSNLKFIISSPYRRMRILFRGHMKLLTDSNDSNELTFVKLSLVLSPTGQIFDFYTQFDEDCFKRMHHDNKLRRSFEQTLTDLQFQDRHEQLIRATGECTIFKNKDNKTKEILFYFGFHARHFLPSLDDDANTATGDELQIKRILGYLINGQAFHVGSNQIGDDRLDFGYTSYEVGYATEPIEKPTVIDWTLITETCTKMELQVSGQGKTLNCVGERRFGNVFSIEMNDKPGSAWLFFNDSRLRDPEQLSVAIQKSYDELQQGMKSGLINAINLSNRVCDGSQKPLVVSIRDLVCTSSDLVGSKAASLALLRLFSSRESSFQVPDGVVLTRYAYDGLLDHNDSLRAEIDKLERLIGSGDVGNLKLACESLQALVEQAELPVILRKELLDRLVSDLGGGSEEGLNGLTLAVRSSSWGEDQEDMSAAGQLSTVLGVTGGLDSILKAVRSCFASKFNYANVEYKRQHGLEPNSPMAVVVQVMVECEKAGVMFTCDPTTGDDQIITVTANYGLGESVVSGQSEPDLILLRRSEADLKIEEIKLGQKSVIIDADSLKGNRSNQYDKSKCCLAEDEVLKLARCGLNVARYFQCQRDVEWGFKGNQLYLFQSRPITGLDRFSEHELIHESEQPSKAELEFSTRANIGEVMPYALTPFTLTCSIMFWNVSGDRLLNLIGGFGDRRFSPECTASVLQDSYHNLFQLRCSIMFPMQQSNPEMDMVLKSMEVAFFGHEIDEESKKAVAEASKGLTPPPHLFHGLRYEWLTLSYRISPMAKIMREKGVVAGLRRDVTSLKLATSYQENKMLGLLNQIKNIYRPYLNIWFNHIWLMMIAGNTNMALSRFLSKFIKDPVQLSTAVSKFLGLGSDAVSAEIPERINKMASIIKKKGQQERDRFLEMSTNEALDYIRNSDEELDREFKLFIEKFGHRCYDEFELAEKSWAENKELVVDMLKKNCRVDGAASEEGRSKRLADIDQVIESLNLELGKKDRLVLKHLLGPRCSLMVAARERTKDILIEFHDVLRQATRMLAAELRENKRIPDVELFYYFFYDEIEPLIREPQPGLVVQAGLRRSMFKKVFKEPWRFDEIIPGYHLIPNHLKPSKELAEQVANAPKLFGSTASYGRVQAKVCLVKGYQELAKVREGDILVTHSTDIAFSPVFPLVVGIVTEVGGLISHGAVVAREYGLPSILGIPEVTRILEDGEEIVLDADNGVIIRLSKGAKPEA